MIDRSLKVFLRCRDTEDSHVRDILGKTHCERGDCRLPFSWRYSGDKTSLSYKRVSWVSHNRIILRLHGLDNFFFTNEQKSISYIEECGAFKIEGLGCRR